MPVKEPDDLRTDLLGIKPSMPLALDYHQFGWATRFLQCRMQLLTLLDRYQEIAVPMHDQKGRIIGRKVLNRIQLACLLPVFLDGPTDELRLG